ncbi:MAG: hypothetical protein KatS3mg023_0914 [Armatimonadota bacterium]|nr:MAG: hypothetical protein KatS3mg023_0914 [Armatimonadota bacterium]
MPSSRFPVRAVVFDFVNTLVPLREPEFLRILQGVYEYVHPFASHVPFDAFVQHYVRIRDEQYARNLPVLRGERLLRTHGDPLATVDRHPSQSAARAHDDDAICTLV